MACPSVLVSLTQIKLSLRDLEPYPNFLFSNFEKFRELPSKILDPSRCPHSRKPSKFEIENENYQGFEVSLTALIEDAPQLY